MNPDMLEAGPVDAKVLSVFDFDGTLTEMAPRPEAVRISAGLVPTLAALSTHLDGALAIVTGRRETDIDHFLDPLVLPLASEHGSQYRLADGSRPAVVPPIALGNFSLANAPSH